MKGLLAGLIAAVVAIAIGAVLFFVLIDSSDSTEVRQESRTYAVNGSQQTCADFYEATCDFDTQYGFNRWADGLDGFVGEQRMGSFARDIGFVETSKIALETCILTSKSGKTIEDLLDYTRPKYPEANTAAVFPIWNAARWHLCPLPR
ncbi:hypothetical protein HT102_14125 [Hoyosella sp. G463]|uniref:Uncharacterized protein n=1 Tax=Lolliginicoccus lacisalsi TaxID=2742202 RepID=A0A927PLX4_9ACTN|nr:hypothetical protein [Lolliginicoccus lacisalsi]MBD8507620.1 hypothetical protein [Lolliginicoccus lacisalsi]